MFFPLNSLILYFYYKTITFRPLSGMQLIFRYYPNRCYDLHYKLWEGLIEANVDKDKIKYILSVYYPHHKMNQKVFFFDPKLDKPYPKHDKHGIYGTDEIQKIIYENQFPKNCSERNFILIPRCPHQGLGSYVHVTGSIIAKDIDLNRTVIYDPNENYRFIDCKQCHNTSGFDCYFQPISSCKFSKDEIDYSNPKFMRVKDFPKYTVPKSIMPIINQTGVPPQLYRFYWRIQAAYFFVRFNDNLKKWIKEFRDKSLVNPKDHYDVSMHIRKGDKYREMKIINTSKYIYTLEVIEKLIRKDKPISVFVSSDEQESIDYVLQYRDRFDISYYNFTRQTGGFDLHKINDYFSMALSSFANLEDAVNADYIIGTLSSNWNRLILELNLQNQHSKNVSIKFPYYEVGDVVCTTPKQCEICNKALDFRW